MAELPPLVCKVGGSLLGWPELFPRLTGYLKTEQRPLVLIAGGGPAADAVRDWDRQHHLGEETAHWLAIRALRLGEALLQSCIPRGVVISSRSEAQQAWETGAVPILNVEGWLQGECQNAGVAIPHDWNVTSDSIAAVVARSWNADLLLCKSTTPEQGGATFVDPTFAQLSRGLRVSWWDLRSGARGSWNAPTPGGPTAPA